MRHSVGAFRKAISTLKEQIAKAEASRADLAS